MRRKKLVISLSVVLGVVLLLAGAFGIYFGNYYRSKTTEDVFVSDSVVAVRKEKDYVAFQPTAGYSDGLIFYQGAKVAAEAYAPMLRQIAERGILCVLVEMPLNFALFDIDAAEGVMEDYATQSVDWYIGGHSLGGSMAAMHASESSSAFKGVVLFASYSTKDLKNLDVLSIYGTQDGVLNIEKYQENKANLPADFVEVVIEGGNHANFAYYGEQKGDGVATLSREEQIAVTVTSVCAFVQG